jgi:hypothetical protein
MAKYVMVNEAPVDLRRDEYVVKMPDFMQEIEENAKKAPRSNNVGINHLRTVVGTIGMKYDPTLTAWNIQPFNYEARPYANWQEFSAMVLELLKEQHPSAIHGYIDAMIKARPHGTKLVYFVGPFEWTTMFVRNGIDSIELKDVDVYLGLKQKKVNPKAAISDEERAEKAAAEKLVV